MADDELVPLATPATPDLVCWIWAAIPPKDGRIHVARVAEALGVSRSTIYRWLRDPEEREFNETGMKIVRRRAILRGHGDYLWPPLDDGSRRRIDALRADAQRARSALTTGPEGISELARLRGAVDHHDVYLVHYPKARVYGVASGRTHDTERKIRARHGEVLQRRSVPDRYAARLLKYAALDQVDEHTCIPPKALVPVGRTETWNQRAGRIDLEQLDYQAGGASA